MKSGSAICGIRFFLVFLHKEIFNNNMAKKKIDKEKLSINEEMLMWTSYRYCIGRKTYVVDLAYYIAQKYYKLLSDERMRFTAEDIRKSIADCLSFKPCSLRYDGTVSYCDRRPLEDLIQFMTDNKIDSEEKFLEIDNIEIYHDTYKEGAEHKYRVQNKTVNTRNYVSQSDIDDLIPWAKLAACFDKSNYKKVHVNFNNEDKEIICFESWVSDTQPIPEQPGCYKIWPWHWKKIYISVDDFVAGRNHGYIASEYITSVENYNAYEGKND